MLSNLKNRTRGRSLTEPLRRSAALLSLGLLLLGLAGCPRQSDQDQVQLVELEPMFFTILKSGTHTTVKDFDIAELFDRAEKLFKQGKVSQAKKIYLMIAEDASETGTAGLAWFNIALCELTVDKPGAALEALLKAETTVETDEERLHVALLRVQALEMSGEWDRLKELGTELLQKELPGLWSARVNLMMGQALTQEDSLAQAQLYLQTGLDLLLSQMGLKEQYRDRLVASAYFRLGTVFRKQFERVKFKLPVDRMVIDMSDKLALMRQAEKLYLDAVTTRNHEWSPRAGFEVARLYENFALDLMQAEVPADFDELERQVYTEELNAKLLPFLRRAEDILHKNVTMADTYRFSPKWRKKSQDKAKKITEMIKNLTRTEISK